MDEILIFSSNIEANEVTDIITSSASIGKLNIFHKMSFKNFFQNPSLSSKIVLLNFRLVSSP